MNLLQLWKNHQNLADKSSLELSAKVLKGEMQASVASNTGNTQGTKILHYVYDPLCGWCYGIAPLIEVVSNAFQIPLVTWWWIIYTTR